MTADELHAEVSRIKAEKVIAAAAGDTEAMAWLRQTYPDEFGPVEQRVNVPAPVVTYLAASEPREPGED